MWTCSYGVIGVRVRGVPLSLHCLQAKLAFERLDISKDYHPFISGPNGATAKRIMEETGARINIPPLSLMKNETSVAGDKDGVAKAVAEIQKIHATVVSETVIVV